MCTPRQKTEPANVVRIILHWYAERDSNWWFRSVKPSRLTVHRTDRIYGSSLSGYKNNPNPQMWFGLFFFGTPKGTRTPDLLIRSQSLYPTELSAHSAFLKRLDIIAQLLQKSKYFFRFFENIFEIICGAFSRSAAPRKPLPEVSGQRQ